MSKSEKNKRPASKKSVSDSKSETKSDAKSDNSIIIIRENDRRYVQNNTRLEKYQCDYFGTRPCYITPPLLDINELKKNANANIIKKIEGKDPIRKENISYAKILKRTEPLPEPNPPKVQPIVEPTIEQKVEPEPPIEQIVEQKVEPEQPKPPEPIKQQQPPLPPSTIPSVVDTINQDVMQFMRNNITYYEGYINECRRTLDNLNATIDSNISRIHNQVSQIKENESKLRNQVKQLGSNEHKLQQQSDLIIKQATQIQEMQEKISNYNKQIETNNDQVYKYNQQLQFIQQYNSSIPTYIQQPPTPILQPIHHQSNQSQPYYQQQYTLPPQYQVVYSPTESYHLTTLETDNTQ